MHICIGLAFLHVFLSSEGISHCLSFNETLSLFFSDMTSGKILQYMPFRRPVSWQAMLVCCICYACEICTGSQECLALLESCIYRNSFHDRNCKLLAFCLICSCFTSSLLGIPLIQFQQWSNLLVTQNQMGQEWTCGQAKNAMTLRD